MLRTQQLLLKDRPLLGHSLLPVLLLTASLSSLSASAQAPSSGAALPNAERFQEWHGQGQRLGQSAFEAETLGPVPAPKDNLQPYLDRHLKEKGGGLSDTERQVVTDAFWEAAHEADEAHYEDRAMTSVNPPSIMPPTSSPTSTTLKGTTATQEPGVLQLTDKEGNSVFVDVDKDGNYSRTVPGSFAPTKMKLWTDSVKAAWQLQGGKWIQISSQAGGPGAQRTGQGDTAGSAAYALADECNRFAMLSSNEGTHGHSPMLYPVRLAHQTQTSRGQTRPLVWLVSDPLPPDAVKDAQRQGIEHADREFERSELEKIPKSERTKEQTDRLNELNEKINNYNNGKSSPLANKEFIDVAEKAAAARRLQRQAQQLRDGGNVPQADGLDATARQLMGGNQLPPLPEHTKHAADESTGTKGEVEGKTSDSSWNPVRWGMATGSLILRDEHPRSLENPNLDRHLREAPVDGCTPFDSTDGDGKFKLRYEFKYNFGPKLDPKYNLEYKQDSPKPPPAPPTPQTPADKPSGSIGYVPNIATYKTVIGWKCASASATDTIPAIGLSAERPWKIDVGLITLDTTLSYSFAFKNGTSRDWVNKAIEYAGYPAKNLTIDEHAVGPVGSFGNLRLGGAEASTFPSTLTKLLSSDKESDRALGSLIHRGIVYGEEDGCVEIAPAPSWDPTHWPEDPVTSLPKTDVRLDE